MGQLLWAHSPLVPQGSLVRFFELVSHCVHHWRAALETQCIIKVTGVKGSQINQIKNPNINSAHFSSSAETEMFLFTSLNSNETYDQPLCHILLDCSASIPVRATAKTIKVMRTKQHQPPQWQRECSCEEKGEVNLSHAPITTSPQIRASEQHVPPSASGKRPILCSSAKRVPQKFIDE